jgi:hypothetical protein
MTVERAADHPHRQRRRRLAAGWARRVVGTVAAAAALASLSACQEVEGPPAGAPPSTVPSISILRPDTSPATDPSLSDHFDVFVRTADDVVLPNPERTPGARFDDIGRAEICELHYTQGIRQPRFNDKVSAFAGYGISIRDRDIYQVDHLIPVALGGSNAEENLWPQPYDETSGAYQKDLLERQLRGLVCSDRLTLAEAQHAIATNWWQAYEAYMGLPIDPGTAGPEPPEPPTTVPGEVVNGGLCPAEGEVGYTQPKQVRLTCTATSWGELRWQKRY